MGDLPKMHRIDDNDNIDPRAKVLAPYYNKAIQLLINGKFFDPDQIRLILLDKENNRSQTVIGVFISAPNESVGFGLVKPITQAYAQKDQLQYTHNLAYTIIYNFAEAIMDYFIGGRLMKASFDLKNSVNRRQRLRSDWMWLISFYQAISDLIPEQMLKYVENQSELNKLQKSEMDHFKKLIGDSLSSTDLEASELINRLKAFNVASLIMFSAVCIKLELTTSTEFYKKALDLFQEPKVDPHRLDLTIFRN